MAMTVKELLVNFIGNDGRMAIGFDTALKSLRPNARFTVTTNDGELKFSYWEDDDGLDPPTMKDVMEEQSRQEKVQEHFKYYFDRSLEFPPGYEQLDILWHDINSGKPLSEGVWFNTIKEIKEKYPKPEGPAPE
jgi:hypothetical protein